MSPQRQSLQIEALLHSFRSQVQRQSILKTKATSLLSGTVLNLGYSETGVLQPVRFVVNNRRLFTAGWFGVREK